MAASAADRGRSTGACQTGPIGVRPRKGADRGYDPRQTQVPRRPSMPTTGQTEARKLHGSLSHPIIDADGHWVEYLPHMRAEFRRIGGDTALEALWFLPTKNTLDRATAMLPRLMYERLDDLGLDFTVIYPTNGLGYHRVPDARLRRALCRAYNVFTAEQFRAFSDRIIPAAIIPVHTPEEAIEELEFASK